jgi:hypothetical protein
MGKVDTNLEVTAIFFKNQTHVLKRKLVYVTNKIMQRKVTRFSTHARLSQKKTS